MRESKRERDSNSQYEIRELRSLFWTTKIENILTLTERLNFMKFQQQQQWITSFFLTLSHMILLKSNIFPYCLCVCVFYNSWNAVSLYMIFARRCHCPDFWYRYWIMWYLLSHLLDPQLQHTNTRTESEIAANDSVCCGCVYFYFFNQKPFCYASDMK